MLILNRPERLNAMTPALVEALGSALEQAGRAEGLRAVVLTGAGRAFCAGVDLDAIAASGDPASAFVWHGPQSLFAVAARCPLPIISAVNGPAITGGLELALLGDFLVASERAVFADTHARLGITPSWGLTQILPRTIGRQRARRMSLTGEFVDARRAEAWGLVTEVVEHDALMERAVALAREIAETEPRTLGRIRALMTEAEELPLAAGLARERAVFDEHISNVRPEDVATARARVVARGRRVSGGRTTGEE